MTAEVAQSAAEQQAVPEKKNFHVLNVLGMLHMMRYFNFAYVYGPYKSSFISELAYQ